MFSLEISVCHHYSSLELLESIFVPSPTPSPPKNYAKPTAHPFPPPKSKHLQCEDFVPFWIEVPVDSMCQQSVIVQFNYTKRVTFTCKRKFRTNFMN